MSDAAIWDCITCGRPHGTLPIGLCPNRDKFITVATAESKQLAYLEQENDALHSKLRQLEIKLEKAEKALAVEREACAKVAEEYGIARDNFRGQPLTTLAASKQIAQLIRGRGEK